MQSELSKACDALEESCRRIVKNDQLSQQQYEYVVLVLKRTKEKLDALMKSQNDEYHGAD